MQGQLDHWSPLPGTQQKGQNIASYGRLAKNIQTESKPQEPVTQIQTMG
jgi:hypothetical protein